MSIRTNNSALQNRHAFRSESSMAMMPYSIINLMSNPAAWALGFYLIVMSALSFAWEPAQAVAMKIRWPLLGMAFCIGIGSFLFSRRKSLHFSIVSLALFLLVASASAAYSSEPMYSFQRSMSLWLLFGATIIGVTFFTQKPERLFLVSDVFWSLGAFTILLGLAYSRGSFNESGRYEGLFSRATGAGVYAAIFAPICLFQIRYRFAQSSFWKFVGWSMFLAAFMQMALASSRMALLCSLVSCTFLAWKFYGNRIAIFIVAAIILSPLPFALNYFSLEKVERNTEHLVRSSTFRNLTGRWERWQFGLEQYLDQPIIGHGFGSSRTIALEKGVRELNAKGDEFALHSDQIEVLVDLGTVGWCFFAMFWIGVIVASCKAIFSKEQHRENPLVALGSTFACLALFTLADTFMHGGFLSAGLGTSSWTWIAIAMLLSCNAHVYGILRTKRPSQKMQTSEITESKSVEKVLSNPKPFVQGTKTFNPKSLPSVKKILANRN